MTAPAGERGRIQFILDRRRKVCGVPAITARIVNALSNKREAEPALKLATELQKHLKETNGKTNEATGPLVDELEESIRKLKHDQIGPHARIELNDLQAYLKEMDLLIALMRWCGRLLSYSQP